MSINDIGQISGVAARNSQPEHEVFYDPTLQDRGGVAETKVREPQLMRVEKLLAVRNSIIICIRLSMRF